jgi:hypothetical protein
MEDAISEGDEDMIHMMIAAELLDAITEES